MGGGLKQGQKVTLIIQITGKKPKTSKAVVKKFKDEVRKVARANGARVTEV